MLDRIVAYVNYYFPQNKTEFYDDNFIKACLAFREFWKHYHKGRGCVYVFNSPFKNEVLGYLTGIVYWFFHRGVV